jgi:undecaprenyl-phosphate 4-deoxy-4-formamido-L-arabinose transferase
MYSSVSIVIPVYNSERSLGELCDRLEKVLACVANEYEIIMVDDGSMDNSFKEMSRLHSTERALRIISLEGNFGQQNAIMCGLRHSTGDYVITIDDDLQNPPEEITKLLEKLETGYDVVYGIPTVRKQYGVRNLGTIMTDLFFNMICSKPGNVRVGSFRGLKRSIVEKIINDQRSFVYITAITLKYTRNIGNVEVSHEERKYGSSNYSFCKLVKLFYKLFVNYSGLSVINRRNPSPQYIIKNIY